MGIFLFVLKYMYISLLLDMTYGFSWPAKIMASPFKFNTPVLWEVHTKLVLILTPVGVSFNTTWC